MALFSIRTNSRWRPPPSWLFRMDISPQRLLIYRASRGHLCDSTAFLYLLLKTAPFDKLPVHGWNGQDTGQSKTQELQSTDVSVCNSVYRTVVAHQRGFRFRLLIAVYNYLLTPAQNLPPLTAPNSAVRSHDTILQICKETWKRRGQLWHAFHHSINSALGEPHSQLLVHVLHRC